MYTDNTRLASVFLVFGATLHPTCPIEWIDIHKSKESFVRNLEDPTNPEYQPKPKVTFNFNARSVPETKIIEAFEADFEKLNLAFEELVGSLPDEQKKAIQIMMSQLIARACHEVLLRREWLVKHLIKNVPRSAKFDQISGGGRTVRIGKRSSPELRKHYLSKLPN